VTGMHPFTPRWQDGDRAEMLVDAADYQTILAQNRRTGWELAITDLMTGKRYLVRGADCDSPGCGCDAVVVREMASN
jgi:hypothetical protein